MCKALFAAALGLSLSSLSSVAFAAPDPLLDKMAGTWVGAGERVQTTSGRHIRIEAHTVATQQGEKLFSHNEVTETDLTTQQSKTYSRDYWVRPSAGQAGAYDFGAEENVTSQGYFDGGILEVEQNFGGTPPYVVHSRTQFDDQGSLYEENVWSGDRALSKTQIRYHR